MKKIFNIFAIALIGVIASSTVACNGGTEPEKSIEVFPVSLEFGVDGGLKTVVVTGADWLASTPDGWIRLSAASGEAGTSFDVVVGPSDEQLMGEIVVTDSSGGNSRTVVVTKEGRGEDPRGYEFVDAVSFFQADWIEGAGVFLINMFGFERDADNRPTGEGYQLFMHLISWRALLNQPIIEIPEGEYPFSQLMAWETVFLGADPLTDMLTGIEYVSQNGQREVRLIEGGNLKVSGSARNYLMELTIDFQDGTQLKAFYEGPMLIQNQYNGLLSTLTEDRVGIEADHGTMQNMGVLLNQGVYTWILKLYEEGLSTDDNGNIHGSGSYVELEVNAAGGETTPAGTYDVNNLLFAPGCASIGELLFDMNAPNNGRVGSWYYAIEDGEIVDFAPLMSGTVAIGQLGEGNSAVCTVNAEDGQGNSIEVYFSGALRGL